MIYTVLIFNSYCFVYLENCLELLLKIFACDYLCRSIVNKVSAIREDIIWQYERAVACR